jgi:hypothetical protein
VVCVLWVSIPAFHVQFLFSPILLNTFFTSSSSIWSF